MSSLIVCVSVSNGNTWKVAEAMAGVLGAELVKPEAVDPARLADFDLVGVGSGVYGMAFHHRIRAFIDAMPPGEGRRAFVFATRGAPGVTAPISTGPIERRLTSKGYRLAGTFTCLGWDTWLPLRLIGGINKGRPNADDLAAARAFARDLRPADPERAENSSGV